MQLKPDSKPFPIPVVPFGAGSQEEDETLDYITMPTGMSTYRPPVLPEPEQVAGHERALDALRRVLAALKAAVAGAAAEPVSLHGLPEADLALVNQVLGEGEVSARVLAQAGQGSAEIQESVFAGVWRVIEQRADGSVRDSIEVGPIPSVLLQAALEDGRSGPPPASAVPPGVMNAPAIVSELEDQRRVWRPGRAPHTVNLTLLPLSPDDIAYLDHRLGTGRVLILSRGYGNCRITDTCVPHTWRVVYYNSQDAVILNSVEVSELPDVARAAPEDLQDSAERLAEVLAWVQQG